MSADWFCTALGHLGAAVALHAVVCRIKGSNVVVKYALVALVVGAALARTLWLSYGLAWESLAAFFVFVFGSELYVFMFTFVISSVSVSLLMTLRRGSLELGEIDRRYRSEDMVEGRIQNLLRVEFIAGSPENCTLAPKGARTHAIFQALRGFFKHPDL